MWFDCLLLVARRPQCSLTKSHERINSSNNAIWRTLLIGNQSLRIKPNDGIQEASRLCADQVPHPLKVVSQLNLFNIVDRCSTILAGALKAHWQVQ
jgi:hypothetical protein